MTTKTFAAGLLTLTMTVPAGSEDVNKFYARIKKSDVTLSAMVNGADLLTASSVTGAYSGGTSYTALPLTTAGAPTSSSFVLPAAWGGATMSGAQIKYAGQLYVSTSALADFLIADDGTYIYLYQSYLDSDSFFYTGGSTTTMKSSSVFSAITSGAAFDVYLTSRRSAYVHTISSTF